MNFKVFAVYDHKARIYSQPFVAPTVSAAIRGFSSAVKEPSHDYAKYPDDFELFEVGDWDDNTGALTSGDQITSHGKASNFVSL